MAGLNGINPLGTSRTQHGLGPSDVGSSNGGADNGAVSNKGRSGDALTVSTRGRVVAEAARAIAQTPEIRAEKVAALKAAIKDGTYTVDPEAIATRLLSAGIADE